MSEGGILIAGGYGVVGQRIAADLAPDYRVIVAGRHLEQAKATAAAIGHGACGRELDVTSEASITAALQGVETVVSCIDQPQRRLLHATIWRGLRYTDITPHLVELGRGAAYDEIGAAARASGAHVVLGTGIVPGISNVIVRAIADSLGGADVIETSLVLSASDAAGPASFDYFLKELTMPFEVHVNGADHPAHAFSDPRVIEFPLPFGPRPAYLFPFSDQVLYPQTMGAQTALTRLAIEPATLSRLLAAAVRVGAARLVAQERVPQSLARRRPDRTLSGAARFALRVDVTHHGRSAHATLVGGAQADAAAAGASGTVRALMEGEIAEPGVWMPEQVIDPPRFFSHLIKHGLIVTLPAVDDRPRRASGARAPLNQEDRNHQ
ncbi:MAG TPA: saccharopine dehydrogenase NADP-binding domain-containing protein [Vicinamibacterales bacterium]|nr:saccharopine dehydrogenase NADP-binding domain-containing protein [Vicinamibacterales bacterium]